MLASVYRSKVKDQMYLYIRVKDDFSEVPPELLKMFGMPEFALQLNLVKRKKLARVELSDVKDALAEQGYFLQIPPSIHDNQADINHNRAKNEILE